MLYIIKHTVTFVFLGLLTIKITLVIFKKNLDKNSDAFDEKHYLLFRLLTLSSIVVSFIVISVVQRNYILAEETPPVERCYYYDEFGHYIHGSRLLYNCPTPNVVKTNNTLSMEFDYTYYGSGDGYNGMSSNDNVLYEYRKVNIGGSRISVEVHYTDDDVINYYRLKEVTNYRADDYTKAEINGKAEYSLSSQTYITNYYEVIIETDFSDGVITQNKKVYLQTGNKHVVDSVTDYDFNDFGGAEPNYEMEYRINYTSLNEHGYEFLLYQYTPSSGYDESEPLYEGMVDMIFGGTRIYFENEQSAGGTLDFSSQMYNYTTNTFTNTSSFVRKYYSGITEYDFTNVGVDISLPTLTTQKDIGIEYSHSENYLQYEFQKYSNMIHFESRHKNNLLYQTDYGYRVEAYGQDGVKDESDLRSYIGEIGYVNFGVDESIISLSNPTNLFYRRAPIFDYNPMIKYMLNLVSKEE